MSSYRYGIRTRLTGAGYEARVAQWMQRKLIQSIQSGTITIAGTTDTATITAVDVTRSTLHYNGGQVDDTTSDTGIYLGRLTFTNATTITGTRTDSTGTMTQFFQVIQYWPGVIRSVQRGTITLTTAQSNNTATITAVQDTARSRVEMLGISTLETNGALGAAIDIRMTNATTVQVIRGVVGSVGDTVVGFQVTEFW